MFNDINYLAIFVAGGIFFIIGGIWYAGIFNLMELLDLPPDEQKKAQKNFPKSLMVYFISGIVFSFVLANIVNLVNAQSFFEGVIIGFWLWLGFALTLSVNGLVFERRPVKIFLMNNGVYLISFLILGGILAIW